MSALAKIKKTAAQHEQNREYDKALALYARVLDGPPGEEEVDIGLFNRAGDIALRVGDGARAVGYFERALDLYAAGGFLNNAVALGVKILRHAPGHLSAHYTLGVLYTRKGFRSEARQHLLTYAEQMHRGGRVDEAARALGELAALCTTPAEGRATLDALTARTTDPAQAAALGALLQRALGGAAGAAVEQGSVPPPPRATAEHPAPSAQGRDALDLAPLVFLDLADGALDAAGEATIASVATATTQAGLASSALAFEAAVAPAAAEPVGVRASNTEGDAAPAAAAGAARTEAPHPATRGEANDPPATLPGELPPLSLRALVAPSANAGVNVVGAGATVLAGGPSLEPAGAVAEPMELDSSAFADVSDLSIAAAAVEGLELLVVEDGDAPTLGFDHIPIDHIPIDHVPVGHTPTDPSTGEEHAMGVVPLDDAPLVERSAVDALDTPGGEVADVITLTGETDIASDLDWIAVEPSGSGQPSDTAGPTDRGGAFDAIEMIELDTRDLAGLEPMDVPGLVSDVVDAPSLEMLDLHAAGELHATVVAPELPGAELPEAFDAEIAVTPVLADDAAAAMPPALFVDTYDPLDVAPGHGAALEFLSVDPDAAAAVDGAAPTVAEIGEVSVPAGRLIDAAARSGEIAVPGTAEASPAFIAHESSTLARVDDERAPDRGAPSPDDGLDLGEWLRESTPVPSTRMTAAVAPQTGDEQADFAAALDSFTAGIARSVEAEDYDSHYDLGIAFREMGLLDEAVGELQRAARAPGRPLRALEALAHCFLDLGHPELTLTTLERAADEASCDGTPEAALVGVHYLLAVAATQVGRRADARGWLVRVLAADYEFRDAASRLAALSTAPPIASPAAPPR